MKRKNSQDSKVGHSNGIKAETNLAHSPHFDRVYGPFGASGRETGYFTYTYLGYEIRLRWSQVSHQWAATCPALGIETSFPNQSIEKIQPLLDNWLTEHVGRPVSFDAHLRQSSPAVRQLAEKHDVPFEIALEIYEERGM